MANGAELEEVGAGNSGQQTQGVVAGYQLEAKGTASYGDIKPYDSGTILGTVPPGKVGLKLVDGTQQRATQIIASADSGYVGDALVSDNGVGLIPTPPAGSAAADGLSQAPQHE